MEIIDEDPDEKRVVVRLTDAISNNTYTLELSEEDAKKIETDQQFAEEMLEKIRQEIAESGDFSGEYEVTFFGSGTQIIEEVRHDKDNKIHDLEKDIKMENNKSEDDMEYEDVEYLDHYDAPDIGNGKKRWTSEQSLELLKAIKYYFEDLKDPRKRKSSWNAICNKVKPKMKPVKIDPQDCRIKWRNLVRTFMNVRKNLKKTGRGPLKFEFYEEIAQILRNDNYRFGYNISPFEDPIFGDIDKISKPKEMDKTRPLIPNSLLNLDITDLEGIDEEESMIPVKKFWAKDQTSSLISAVKTHMCDLRNPKRRKQAWENVAKELKLMGIQLTSLDCKVKWRNLMKSFVSVINNPSDEDPSSRFCFYDEMEQAVGVVDSIPYEKPARSTSSQCTKGSVIANSLLPSYVVPVVPSDLVGVDRSKYLKLREEKWIKKQEEWKKRHEERKEKMELRKQEMELEKKKVALLERMSNEDIDYDKQFQADLERAQALSLESLALEKFRMQKRLQQLSVSSVDSTDSNNTSIEIKEREREEPVRSESFKLKSRPRPGTLSTVQLNPIIAPPPPAQKKTTSQLTSDGPDLISFTSPPSSNKLIDFREELQRLNDLPPEKPIIPPVLNQASFVAPPQIGFHRQLSFGRPQFGFISAHHSFQNGYGVPAIPLQTPDQMYHLQVRPSTPVNQETSILPSNVTLALPGKTSPSLDVFKVLNKQDNSNLIDLATQNSYNTHITDSVLEAFDPLCSPKRNPSSPHTAVSPEYPGDDSVSVCSGSMYEEYDPFEYLYSASGSVSVSEPIYATITRTDCKAPLSPPPLPPRLSQSTLERKRNTRETWINRKSRLYENVTINKRRASLVDCDLKSFYKMVRDIRDKFKYNDVNTNSGIIISPMMENQYKDDTSIKLCIYSRLDETDSSEPNAPPVIFTCNVTCSVAHVTLHVVCELDLPSTEKYRLKVWGLTEYLAPETALSDYEYVHNCIKLEQDVVLCLVPDYKVDRLLARTLQDDKRNEFISLTDLLPNEPVVPISHDNLMILLETLEKEMDRVEKSATEVQECGGSAPLKHSGVVQAVKAVCTLMGSLETPEISEALSLFVNSCETFSAQTTSQIHGSFDDPYRLDKHKSDSLLELITARCNHIRGAVQALIEMYCQAFRVDFKLGPSSESPTSTMMVSELPDWVALRICALHRLPLHWKHDNYGIEAQVYHGTRKVGFAYSAPSLAATTGVSPRLLFNYDLILEGVSLCTLARESRLVLVLYGFTVQQPSDNTENSSESQYVQEELGWTAFQFFNYEGVMAQGSMLLSLWPPAANRWIGPAPVPGTHPLPEHPVLGVELLVPHPYVIFPDAPRPTSPETHQDFYSLDPNTQQQLLEIIEQDTLSNPPVEVREVLWEKRHYLQHLPAALPKVLLAAHSWDWASLANLHALLHSWTPMQPLQALQLLLPCFPDMEVRRLAVEWIHNMSNDELVDYLPQLVQALKHETYETSWLAKFLLEKSLSSPRIAHHLYWLLTQSLPGQCPQNTTWEGVWRDERSVCDARHHRRLQLVLRALLAVSGETLRNCLMAQQLLVKNLYEIAEEVKQAKESMRLKVLSSALESVHQTLVDSPNCLPLSPSLRVAGVQVRTCSYFPSNTLPLKINFLAPDATVVPAIFKVGDDLQQDMLTIQMVRIMDKLWLREGLDLKMVSFACIPTGHKRGMIEMVSNAETLRKIQVEWGLTGSFKDKPIAEWLAKHNPSELEYERARENFTASCAGYSVVTYILGICDRHNDNIMLKTSGHVFHIDFGKFLGDAQMFGNFKRDRTPFVLTSDMAFVINGGDRPSERFHKFVDLCCQAFNVVRANGNLILNLFTFMASSGIPGVTTEAVNYIRNALLPGKSNPEAAALFARLIQSSLKSWFTQFNFFLHNLAQLRFTGDHGDGELLSFVPKTYTMIQEGRLRHVTVYGYEKRYDPDKYYVYILSVEREGQPHPINILRTYKEFCELHQKLCLHFPLAKIHSLPTGIHMGRSNIKQVAEKRLHDIRLFIHSLFLTADEIAHSDLVYTFFHPMLRDQQNMDFFNRHASGKIGREDIGRVRGQLKLTFQYQRGTLSVMVHHARSLPLMANSQEPSTYVKVYLQPDPTKSTKRKTKVVKRNCHPSFMEMLEYRLALDVIKSRILQATVWNHDPLQENEFLGGVALELAQFNLTIETTEWFPLTNLSR